MIKKNSSERHVLKLDKKYKLIQDSISEASWKDVILEDLIRLEIGYKLIPMTDINQKGDLLDKIRIVRKKIAQDIGFLPPLVHIKNNMNLSGNVYRIFIKGVEVGKGQCFFGRLMAIYSDRVTEDLPFDKINEPTFGLSGYWIDQNFKHEAQQKGYSVIEPSTVISTHLNFIISNHISELFGRQEAQQLLEHVSVSMPKITEDLIPNVINLTIFHKVLKNLLLEQVPIRDMRTILETLSECAETQKDPNELTSILRISLRKIIMQKLFDEKNIIDVMGLESNLEQLLLNSLKSGTNVIEPTLSENLIIKTKEAIKKQLLISSPLVLLVSHPLRYVLSKFLRKIFPELIVLSQFEITDIKKIRMNNIISI